MTITWSLPELFSRATRAPVSNPEVERWKDLLHWAAQSPYYWKQSAQLADMAACESASAIRSQLRALPPMPLDWFLKNADQFRSGYSRTPASQRCTSFWETPANIVLVRPWFPTSDARTVDGSAPVAQTVKAINRLKPDVLVAPPGMMLKLVRSPLETPRRALIAIHTPGAPLLRESERDLLWQRFKVPLYQQLRGFQGELLAAECDAQVGFHANEAIAHWELRRQELVYTSLMNLRHPVLRLGAGWYGDLETSRCGCGCRSIRLFPYERQPYGRRIQAGAGS